MASLSQLLRLLLLLATLSVSRAAVVPAVPVVEYYIMALAWPQSSCELYHAETGGGCVIPRIVAGWTVHGLWAEAAASRPQNCTGPPLNTTQLRPARAALARLWPEVYANQPPADFWQHEWLKHGTCALAVGDVSSQLDYFMRCLELAVRYDPGRALRSAGLEPQSAHLSRAELLATLQDVLPRRFIVKCHRLAGTERYLLSELRVCVDRQWQPTHCYPPDGSAYRTDGCDADTVYYPPLRYTDHLTQQQPHGVLPASAVHRPPDTATTTRCTTRLCGTPTT